MCLEACETQLMGLLVGLRALTGGRVTDSTVFCCALYKIIVGLETCDYTIKLLRLISVA